MWAVDGPPPPPQTLNHIQNHNRPPTTQQAVAKHLEAHPTVTKVLYPGLPSHPQYALAQKQQHGPGAMITFYVKGDLSNARKFLENLKVFILAESLGAGAFFCMYGVCVCVILGWVRGTEVGRADLTGRLAG